MPQFPFQQLTLDDGLRSTTLGELLDRAAHGPLEVRDASGHPVAVIHGGWITLGEAPYPGQDPSEGKTTAELMESLRAIDRRAEPEPA